MAAATLAPPQTTPGPGTSAAVAPSPSSPATAAVPGTIESLPNNPPLTSGEKKPIKPGSARERFSKALHDKYGDKPAQPEVKPTVATQPPEPPKAEETATETPPVEQSTESTETSKTTEKPKKANPWKLIDEWKAKAAKLEQDIVQLKSSGVPKEVQERIDKAEARAKELENEIRFVNYEKSDEYKEKYFAPYENAWKRAMSDLSEITVDNGQGAQRPVTANDMLQLVNLPLGKARELADQIYGAFADDVMAHRKEIRSLFDAKNAAVEEARKNGETREKQLQEQFQKSHAEVTAQIKEHWDKSNQLASSDEKYGKYFTPVEGDEDGNQRLAKGYQLVDRAFAENPMDPKLSAEERKSVVRRHAAVRNRAAAFGRLVLQLSQKQSQIDALTKQLDGYKNTEPPTTGSRIQPNGTAPTSARERVFGKLREMAR